MSQLNRRKFLFFGVQVPAAILISKAAAAATCGDPDNLSNREQGMRESMEYTDEAPDPKQACSGCSFFMAEEGDSGCGGCSVLGGQVNSAGHCVSWTKRS